MSRIGIDFGTSFCAAARVNPKTGLSEAITFRHTGDSQKIPTVVFIPEIGNPEAGVEVYKQVSSGANYDEPVARRTLKSVKRLMDRNGNFLGYSHQDIISIILKHVVDEAMRVNAFDHRPDELVLTYPVHFHEWQKEMLKAAAVSAGFASDKIFMMPEPVSAAMAYVKQIPENQNKVNGLLVFDFGGGTFDLAYVSKDRHGHFGIEQVDCKGLPDCGGDDIDTRFYTTWDNRVRCEFNRSISPLARELNIPFVLRCRIHKETLSDHFSSESNGAKRISELLPPVQGQQFKQDKWEIDKNTFDSIVNPVVDRTVDITKKMIDEIHQKKLPLDAVLLVGGSSRLPQVIRKISSLIDSNVKVYETGQMDTLVAQGTMCYDEYVGLKSDSNIIEDSKYPFCINCGNRLEPTHAFCMICGTKRYRG